MKGEGIMKHNKLSKYLAMLFCVTILLGSIFSAKAGTITFTSPNTSASSTDIQNDDSNDYVVGDINLSGEFNEEDILVFKEYLLNNITLNDEQKQIADINKDGELNNDDLSRLQEFLLQNNSTLPTVETTSPYFDMKGDLNFDTEVSEEDYQMLQEYLASNIEFNEQQFKNADFDNDGKLTIDDVTYMQKRVAYGHVEIKYESVDQQQGTMPTTVPEGYTEPESTSSSELSTMPTDDGDEGIEASSDVIGGEAQTDPVISVEDNREPTEDVDSENVDDLYNNSNFGFGVLAVDPDDSSVGIGINNISNLTLGLNETYPGTGGVIELPNDLRSINGYSLSTKSSGTYTVNGTFNCKIVVRKYKVNNVSYYQAQITATKVGSETITYYTNSGNYQCKLTIKNAPSSVYLNKNSITLGVGETYNLSESTNSTSYAHPSGLKWSTSNSNIVSVAKFGNNEAKITARSVGSANITITTYNGRTAVCKVTVKKAPSGGSAIRLNKSSLTLGIGEEFDFDSTVQSGSASYHITYTQSNPFVGSLTSAYGIFKAKNIGITKIRATTYNGWYIECTVTVKAAPTWVGLNKTELTLGIGETFDLDSTPLDSYKNSGSVASYHSYYSTNNSKVATVEKAGGLVRAVSVGTAKIRVTTYNGAYETCVITVKKAPTSINLNKTSLTLGVGETYDLNSSLPNGQGAYDITYSSSATGVAPVRAAGGIVTAKAVGTAYVTVRTYNGKTKTCTVTVKSPPTSVSLNKTSITLGAGQRFDLDSSVPSGQAAYHIGYSSSNKNIATVEKAGGLVTAKAPGVVSITAKTYNGKTVSCTVTVKKKPYYVGLSKSSIVFDNFLTGTTGTSIYAIIANDAYCNNDSYEYGYKWTTTNSRVVTVKGRKSNYADITPVTVGTAEIIVRTYNGFTAKCEITVKSNYRSKIVNLAKSQIGRGGKDFCDDMNMPPTDWCAIFCGWCIRNTGYNEDEFGYDTCVGDPGWYGNVKNCSAKYLRVIKKERPEPGDLILYSNPQNTEYREHIGIVETVSNDGVITTIEGNANTSDYNTSTVQRYTVKTDNKSYYGLCTKNNSTKKYNVYCYFQYVYDD